MRRRSAEVFRRQAIYLVDGLLSRLESLIERGEALVPEPLFADITTFVGDLDMDLLPPVRREDPRATSRLLEVLFEAQRYLLLRVGRA